MTREEFDDFRSSLSNNIENIVNNRNNLTEKFRLQLSSLEIILNTIDSVFKYLPDYDLPLHAVRIGGDGVDKVYVEFELFTTIDIILFGAYYSTITEYINTAIGLSLEEILRFTVADVCQYADVVESPGIKTYDVWKILKTEFVITKLDKDSKIKLIVKTGQEFIDDLTRG